MTRGIDGRLTGMTAGVTIRRAETLLTERARDLLAAGPADSCTLITHVCQLPAVPGAVADHMAIALFAGHREFARATDGRWQLVAADAVETRPDAMRREPLHQLPFVVVDVETTGSRLERDRITEVAVVLVEGGEVRTIFETLVNPLRPIPPSVTALTNITWEMVKHAPTFGEVCDQLLGALEGRVFVAHNAQFDWRFISAEVQRATGRLLEGRRLCTVRLSRRILPQLRRRSLDAVSAHYAIEITARHRAGGDARATAQLLVRLLRDARAHGCSTWWELEQMMSRPVRGSKRRRRRPSALPQPVMHDTTA